MQRKQIQKCPLPLNQLNQCRFGKREKSPNKLEVCMLVLLGYFSMVAGQTLAFASLVSTCFCVAPSMRCLEPPRMQRLGNPESPTVV